MSYYEGQGPRWGAQHARQQSWETPHGPPRSGAASSSFMASTLSDLEVAASPTVPHDEPNAFLAQYEEIDRANENLAKSSRMYGMPGRRESVPVPGSFARQYPEFDHRMGPQPRHHSIGGEFDGMRSHSSHSSSSVQGYLAHQRFPPRGGETDHMAKRRAAAQRERELRNYHQEQQYNRNMSGPKSDRSLSPSGMSEEDRRELIARQHRALYGNESNLYIGDGSSSRPMSQDARVLAGASGPHGSSSMNYEAYGAPASSGADNSAPAQTMSGAQPRSRSNSNSSPATNQNTFGMYESGQQTGNPTSSSSPGTSPTRSGSKAQGGGGGVAPIGTRPLQAKRNTPPMPSPLSHGFAGGNERSQSSASNPATSGAEKPSGLGWGGNSGSGPWGSNKAQASVWG